jgi:Fur family ferric uptake transcriptional regulator
MSRAGSTRVPRPLRATRQGAAVRAALAEVNRFASAQDLYAAMRQRGDGIGLSTVYRHLQLLADSGAVDTLQTPDGETVYRLCGSGPHHHHLVCRACGRTVEIEGREVERWTQRVAAAEGFVEVAHTVEIFGTCAACAVECT